MAANQNAAFTLEDIRSVADISSGKAAYLKEACIWCMDYCGYTSGTQIKAVHKNGDNLHAVIWTETEDNFLKIRESLNFDDAIEFGAEAIAFFITTTYTEYEKVLRSSTTTGIDYWLGHKSPDLGLPFQQAARLEISGIMEEKGTNTLDRRVNSKFKQTKQSDSTSLPVYVVVVVFNRLVAKMAVNHVNNQ
jgi:hypothetical protein